MGCHGRVVPWEIPTHGFLAEFYHGMFFHMGRFPMGTPWGVTSHEDILPMGWCKVVKSKVYSLVPLRYIWVARPTQTFDAEAIGAIPKFIRLILLVLAKLSDMVAYLIDPLCCLPLPLQLPMESFFHRTKIPMWSPSMGWWLSYGNVISPWGLSTPWWYPTHGICLTSMGTRFPMGKRWFLMGLQPWDPMMTMGFLDWDCKITTFSLWIFLHKLIVIFTNFLVKRCIFLFFFVKLQNISLFYNALL